MKNFDNLKKVALFAIFFLTAVFDKAALSGNFIFGKKAQGTIQAGLNSAQGKIIGQKGLAIGQKGLANGLQKVCGQKDFKDIIAKTGQSSWFSNWKVWAGIGGIALLVVGAINGHFWARTHSIAYRREGVIGYLKQEYKNLVERIDKRQKEKAILNFIEKIKDKSLEDKIKALIDYLATEKCEKIRIIDIICQMMKDSSNFELLDYVFEKVLAQEDLRESGDKKDDLRSKIMKNFCEYCNFAFVKYLRQKYGFEIYGYNILSQCNNEEQAREAFNYIVENCENLYDAKDTLKYIFSQIIGAIDSINDSSKRGVFYKLTIDNLPKILRNFYEKLWPKDKYLEKIILEVEKHSSNWNTNKDILRFLIYLFEIAAIGINIDELNIYDSKINDIIRFTSETKNQILENLLLDNDLLRSAFCEENIDEYMRGCRRTIFEKALAAYTSGKFNFKHNIQLFYKYFVYKNIDINLDIVAIDNFYKWFRDENGNEIVLDIKHESVLKCLLEVLAKAIFTLSKEIEKPGSALDKERFNEMIVFFENLILGLLKKINFDNVFCINERFINILSFVCDKNCLDKSNASIKSKFNFFDLFQDVLAVKFEETGPFYNKTRAFLDWHNNRMEKLAMNNASQKDEQMVGEGSDNYSSAIDFLFKLNKNKRKFLNELCRSEDGKNALSDVITLMQRCIYESCIKISGNKFRCLANASLVRDLLCGDGMPHTHKDKDGKIIDPGQNKPMFAEDVVSWAAPEDKTGKKVKLKCAHESLPPELAAQVIAFTGLDFGPKLIGDKKLEQVKA